MRRYLRYAGITLKIIAALLLYAFLDYALPSRETVRITNTYNKITPVGGNAIFYAAESTGTTQAGAGQRDIRFIDTALPNGRVRVYRNEDTGLFWPLYFKFDSANLQARATDWVSTRDAPKWVSITSYGWRSEFLTIYPNAVSIRPVAGPEDQPRNWPAVLVCVLLLGLLVLFWRIWAQFHERMIAPAIEDVGAALDRADARAEAARDRLRHEAAGARGWLGRWWNRLRGR